MTPVTRPRLQLAVLWLAHTARCLADFTLIGWVIRSRLRASADTPPPFDPPAELVELTLLALLPAVVLAPLAARLMIGSGRRWLLPVAAAWNLTGAMLAARVELPAEAVLVWIGAGSVTFHVARRSLVADLADAARQPVALTSAVFSLGTLVALLAVLSFLTRGIWGVPLFTVAIGFAMLSLLAALELPTPRTDHDRRLTGSFRDPFVRSGLLGQALTFGVLLAAVWLTLFQANPRSPGSVLEPGWALLGGAFLALVPQFLQVHPYRVAGFAAYGGLLLGPGCIWAGFTGGRPASLAVVACGASMALIALRSYTAAVAPDRLRAAAGGVELLSALVALPAAALVVAVGWLGLDPLWGWLTLAAVALAGAGLAARVFLQETCEIIAELLIWPWNRVRTVGPGLAEFPVRGPVLVIGNHTAYLDPLWVCKMLPARLMPLMAGAYYDLPVLRWLMPRIGVIRVPHEAVRREAPEIIQAVAVLKRGEGVLIFPEGWLRRTEERPMRRFGRGVWQILTECPDVPVYALWIEGGWGSYTSWKGGPPMKNKRLDWRRPIDIAVPVPVVVPREILKDHLATRQLLLSEVLKSRAILGLPPLELGALTGDDDGEKSPC